MKRNIQIIDKTIYEFALDLENKLHIKLLKTKDKEVKKKLTE